MCLEEGIGHKIRKGWWKRKNGLKRGSGRGKKKLTEWMWGTREWMKAGTVWGIEREPTEGAGEWGKGRGSTKTNYIWETP